MSDKKHSSKAVDQGNVYDRIFKQVMEKLALPILGRFESLQIKEIRRLNEKLQTTTQREADFLCEVEEENGDRFILHIEFQSQDDREMLARMQEYHGILTRKYQLPIRHYVFYFGEHKSKMTSQLSEEFIFKGFHLFHFNSLDYRQLLDSDTGQEVILAILADFREKSPDAVIRLIIRKLRAMSQSEAELKSYLSQLTILSRLRKLEFETIKSASDMPITIDVEQDYLYNKGLEQGLQKGAEGKVIEKLITRIEDDFDLLTRMKKENLDITLMQRLSDVPFDLIHAFIGVYTPAQSEHLLSKITNSRKLVDLAEIRTHLVDTLIDFGIAAELVEAYLVHLEV